MESYSVSISTVPAAEFDSAVDGAVSAHTGATEVHDLVSKLGDAAKELAKDLSADYVGGYIAGTHPAQADANTALREQVTISVYAGTAPAAAASQPVQESAGEPGEGGPGDTSAGAAPIGPAQDDPNVVPDGSDPQADTPKKGNSKGDAPSAS